MNKQNIGLANKIIFGKVKSIDPNTKKKIINYRTNEEANQLIQSLGLNFSLSTFCKITKDNMEETKEQELNIKEDK